MKRWKKVVAASCGAYALFFLGSSLIYPKWKMNELTKESNVPLFDEEKFFNIEQTSEKACVFSSREHALDLRCELVDQAKKNIYMTQYAIENDDTGDVLLSHLLKAANRGVKVELIMNGMAMKWKGSSLYKKWALASHPNISLRVYGGVNLLKPWTINNVMHDKLLIIDQQYFMTSGRNIGDRFMLGKHQEQATYDMDLLVKATTGATPIINEGLNYFKVIWKSPYTKSLRYFLPNKLMHLCQSQVLQEGKEIQKQYQASFTEKTLFSLPFVSVEKATLLHNSPNENIKTPSLFMNIASLLNRDQKMVLQTPYLVLTKEMRPFLKNKQHLLTNSTATSPNLFAYASYLKNKKSDLRLFHIMEYQGQGSIHNKGFVTEDHIMGLGSYNTDARSTFLDSENMLVLQGKEICGQLQAVMQQYEEQSLKCQSNTHYYYSNHVKVKKISKEKALLMKGMEKVIAPFSYLT